MTMWHGQVALVTGGARGIGRAIARLLAERGAAVCVNYAAHAVPAEALVAEIMDGGGRAIAAMADVAEKAAVEAMVARTQKELGPVTILVNNAGISWRGTLDTYDPVQAARMRQVNVEGLINATRSVIGGMQSRRYGRIVNLSSIAAIGTALPGNAFYAATKTMHLAPHVVRAMPIVTVRLHRRWCRTRSVIGAISEVHGRSVRRCSTLMTHKRHCYEQLCRGGERFSEMCRIDT